MNSDVAARSRGASPSPLAQLASTLVFCAVLAALLGGERRLLHEVPGEFLAGDGPAQKWRRLEENEGIRMLFLGSSRVYRQLNPGLFDDQMAARGLTTVSYNFGLPGMGFFEELYLAERIADAPPPGLRWLLIELLDPTKEQDEVNRLSRRNIEWHTPALAWFALRAALLSERPGRERLDLAVEHLELLALRSSNAGLAIPALEQLLEGGAPGEDPSPHGFLPLTLDRSATTLARRDSFERDLAANPRYLEERVREVMEHETSPSPLVRARMRALTARLEAAGIRPIFFLSPPATRNNSDWRRLHEEGVLPDLIALDDPEEYPAFSLDASIRFDKNHLDRAGSGRLTRLLAEALSVLLKAEEGR